MITSGHPDDGLLDSSGAELVSSKRQAQRILRDTDASALSSHPTRPWWQFWHSAFFAELMGKLLVQSALLGVCVFVLWFKGLLPSQQKQKFEAPTITQEAVVEDLVDEGLIS
jgi:hypothetical protein